MNGSISYQKDTVVVTADDGTRREFTLAEFKDNEVACVTATGNGIKIPVPAAVSNSQFRVALNEAGMLSKIEEFVAAESTPVPTRIFFDFEPTFLRHSKAIDALAESAGLTQDALDDLFRAAALVTL